MTEPTPDIRQELDNALSKIARAIAVAAMAEDEATKLPFDQMTTAFKCLAAYRMLVNKITPPAPQGNAFDEYRQKVQVPGHRAAGTPRGERGNAEPSDDVSAGAASGKPKAAKRAAKSADGPAADEDPGAFSAFFE